MKEITLTQGKAALVDDSDFDLVNQFKWFAVKGKTDHSWYARRNIWNTGLMRDYPMSMHRFILGAKPGQKIDHKDCNGLNNQRENLRFCSNNQNGANRLHIKSNKTGLKGVVWHNRDQIYEASIRVNWKLIYLGRFRDKFEAANAYDVAAVKHFGEFALTNKKLLQSCL